MSASSGMDRVARLLTLVPWLMANPGISLRETAREFGISEDQLEKDLWTLVVSGLPGHGPDQLIDIDFWDDGLIYVRDPQVLDVSMRLSPEESTALLVGLRLLAQVADEPTRAAVQSAAGRIEAALGGSDSGLVVEVGALEATRDLIESALATSQALAITYGDATRDEITHRTIWPERVYTVDDIAYVEAFCELAGAMRTFRLERVHEVVPSPSPRSVRPSTPSDRSPSADTPTPRRGATGDGAPPTELACVRFEPSVAWAADLHRVDRREPLDDGSVRVWLPFHDPDWLVGQILSIGPGAVVEAPDHLRTRVRAVAQRALRALDGHRA